MLACTYFAALDTPTLAAAASSFFLAGRVAFAQGYYTGNAKNKDAGAWPASSPPPSSACPSYLLRRVMRHGSVDH